MDAAPSGADAATWASSKCFVGHWGVRAASNSGEGGYRLLKEAGVYFAKWIHVVVYFTGVPSNVTLSRLSVRSMIDP